MSTESAEGHRAVFDHFDVAPTDRPHRSVYRYAPVFRTVVAGQPAAVKRTRALPSAIAIAEWLHHLARSGLPVVTPIPTPRPNPAVVGEHTWVAYRWIEGRRYTGSVAEIAAAGELLGRMHAHSLDVAAAVPGFAWPEHSAESVAEDVADLTRVMRERAADLAPAVLARVLPWHRRFVTETLPSIRDADLPEVIGSTDYKANNLVWTDHGPAFIDPDNADRLPRLLDLAMAALLFHNDLESAPPALFSPTQWRTFYRAYAEHVRLTEWEVELWPTAVRYLITEWGTWTLVDADDDWDDPHQATFLRALAQATPEHFPLD